MQPILSVVRETGHGNFNGPALEEKANRRPRRKEVKETESRRVVPAPLRPPMEMIEPKLKESSPSPSWTKVVPSPAKLSTMEWW